MTAGDLTGLAAMTPTRLATGAAAAAVLVLLIVGVVQLGASSHTSEPTRLTAAQVRDRLKGSPAYLQALHEQAGQLLSGGLPALRARLAALRGRPVVVNKWASWCAPCRAEFGVFQNVSVADGRQVAFIGLDSGDTSRSEAQRFLRSFPVSYPSYYDPSGEAGAAITDSAFTPVTVFYNSRGAQYIRQGPYPTVAKLEQDVRRYALEG
jgi:cytochrome c biogenesis protein CcmG, thiol:disulfide interchange protein DsbE